MFGSLKVLDGYDKDGEECLSEIDDEGDYEGEGEGLDNFIDNKDLTEEELKMLEKQGFVVAEDDGEDDEEAEGEEDDADAKAGEKREKAEEKADGDHKRQKTDE